MIQRLQLTLKIYGLCTAGLSNPMLEGKAPTTLVLHGPRWQPGPRRPRTPGHSPVSFHPWDSDFVQLQPAPAAHSSAKPLLPLSRMSPRAPGLRQLAGASRSKEVPHFQTAHTGGTSFLVLLLVPLSQGVPASKEAPLPPKAARPGRHPLLPPRAPISIGTSLAPGRAVKPHFSCWGQQQDKVKQQKQSPARP